MAGFVRCLESLVRVAATRARHAFPNTRSRSPTRNVLLGVGAALLALMLARPVAFDGVGIASAADSPGAAKRESGSATRTRTRQSEHAFGHPGDPRKVKRVLTIETSDAMRYFPDQIRVKKGQTVRLLVRNAGELSHQLVLGTMDDLKKHAALNRQSEDRFDAPNIARVEPGATGRIDWHFTRAGEFYYGCLTPGHFDAGMIGTIVVR